jgi:hypothetical protein
MHLITRQHHRHALRALGARHVIQPRQIDRQHFLVQKQQGRQGLILRGRRHMALHRKMRQKRLDLGRPHVSWMLLAVKQNEAPNPLNILRFRPDAVMLDPNSVAHLVKQFGRLSHRCVCRLHLRSPSKSGSN